MQITSIPKRLNVLFDVELHLGRLKHNTILQNLTISPDLFSFTKILAAPLARIYYIYWSPSWI